MSIPYRTRRVLNRLGIVLMIFLLVGVIAWLCWVVWLERYVVYTADGASLDFEHSAQDIIGEVATPPVAQQNISIYYNEGSDALDTGNELTQINGYFISSNMLQNDINGVLDKLERLPAGTPVMIDMKGPYGSFFYPSHLDGAVHSASTDVDAVAALVDTLMNKKSGLLAVTGGKTNACRNVEELAAAGDPDAQLAFDLFVYKIAAKAAEMATSMCGMDTLVFTAGIGEHAPAVRAGVADRLAFMGVKMDHARNALRGDGAWCLSAKDSKVKIFVIPTDEEFMIASDVERIVNGK